MVGFLRYVFHGREEDEKNGVSYREIARKEARLLTYGLATFTAVWLGSMAYFLPLEKNISAQARAHQGIERKLEEK